MHFLHYIHEYRCLFKEKIPYNVLSEAVVTCVFLNRLQCLLCTIIWGVPSSCSETKSNSKKSHLQLCNMLCWYNTMGIAV